MLSRSMRFDWNILVCRARYAVSSLARDLAFLLCYVSTLSVVLLILFRLWAFLIVSLVLSDVYPIAFDNTITTHIELQNIIFQQG